MSPPIVGADVLRRLLALVLLVNVVAVVPNLPRIVAAVDGEQLGVRLRAWTADLGDAGGALLDDVRRGATEQPRGDADSPAATPPSGPRTGRTGSERPTPSSLGDPAVGRLAEVWRALRRLAGRVDVDRVGDVLDDDPSPTGR